MVPRIDAKWLKWVNQWLEIRIWPLFSSNTWISCSGRHFSTLKIPLVASNSRIPCWRLRLLWKTANKSFEWIYSDLHHAPRVTKLVWTRFDLFFPPWIQTAVEQNLRLYINFQAKLIFMKLLDLILELWNASNSQKNSIMKIILDFMMFYEMIWHKNWFSWMWKYELDLFSIRNRRFFARL